MKKFITPILLLLAAMLPAAAQSDIPKCSLLVNLNDDTTVTYRFADEPVATFSDDDMILTLADDQTVTYPMENIKSLTFESDFTAVGDVKADANGPVVTFTNGLITIDGLQPAMTVRVFDTAGALIAAAPASDNGHTEIATDRLAKGVYVVALPSHSFKFVK